MSHRNVSRRTSGVPVLLVACLLAGALVPADASAQKRPSNNMWTRSVALYLSKAQTAQDFEAKRDLWRQALEAAKEGIAEVPSNPRIWLLAGQVYVQLDSATQAHEAFNKAQEIYPDYEKEIDTERRNAWARWHNGGVTAIQQQNVDAAIRLFEQADLIYDKMPNARLQLGGLYARKGETDRAIEAYRGALEILRGPASQSVPERQREQWRENEEAAAFNLAQLLAGAGRDEEAAQAYRDFLEREPQNRTAKSNLAIVLGRMGKTDEASEIYAELMSQPDLTDAELFSIGIGLYNADEFERAAEAFRKTLALNPHSRDALYNLGQAIYRRSVQIEEQREKGSGDEQVKAASDLGTMYAELQSVTEKLRGMDPYNRNVLLLQVQAYRGQTDLTAEDAATSDEWRNKALAVLQEQEKLPFEVSRVTMAAAEGKVTLSGSVTNLKLDAGTPVKIRLILVDENGGTVGSGEVTVPAPEAEQSAQFNAEIQVSGAAAGWRHEVVS